MLYRFEKKLIFGIFIFTLIIMFSGCSTCNTLSSSGLSPLDIIPEDFSVYVKAEKSALNIPVIGEKVDELSSKIGIPSSFKERTERIALIILNDNLRYIAAQGNYPAAFIKDRLSKDEEWEEGSYKRIRYYFSDSTKTIIIFPKKHIIVSDFPQGGQGVDFAKAHAKKIIDIILSNETVDFSKVNNSVFHITSKSPGNVFAHFVTKEVNFDNIKEVNFDIILDPKIDSKSAPKNRSTGGINISFVAEDEKKALLFNSVIRLFISDYAVKKKITDVKTLRENNSIYHSGDFIYVNILDIPLEKLSTFIADFIIEGASN